MSKTAVGLFESPASVDEVVRSIEALGFARNEVRTLEEPSDFEVTGVMSFPRLDFETDVVRALKRIGAGDAEAREYLGGLRRGGALVFATDPDETRVDAAADIMNLNGAAEVGEDTGPEPQLPHPAHDNMTPLRDSPIVAGRVQQPGSGACFFVW